jgi:hypothetical protein
MPDLDQIKQGEQGWYNSRKSSELMLAAADRQMVETGEKISERIRLLYDPLYAI